MAKEILECESVKKAASADMVAKNLDNLMSAVQDGIRSQALEITKTCIQQVQPLLQALVDLTKSDAISMVAAKAEEGDFSEENINLLLSKVNDTESKNFYQLYRRLTNMRGVPLEIQKSLSTCCLQTAEAENLDDLVSKVDDESQMYKACKDTMGILSAIQSLWRPLKPGETRETVVGRVRNGIAKDRMTLPGPLALLVEPAPQAWIVF